jgi:hypothetical protein
MCLFRLLIVVKTNDKIYSTIMLIFVLFQAIKMVGNYVSIIHYHMFATNSFCNEVWNYILFQRQKNDHLLKKQEQFKLCNKLIPYNLS